MRIPFLPTLTSKVPTALRYCIYCDNIVLSCGWTANGFGGWSWICLRIDSASHEVRLSTSYSKQQKTIRTILPRTRTEGRRKAIILPRKAVVALFPAYENTSFRSNEFLIVEGDDRGRRDRYVTPSPGRYPNINVSGDVTKIEVVLEEAPDDTILAGAVPSESNATIEFNSTYSDGIIPGTGAVVVRAEEALIVVLVLVLWIAAIALFFNRWGKIRMLEPYQPKFQQQQQHRQSCTMVDANSLTHRTYSKFNIHWQDHSGGQVGGWSGCVGGDGFPPIPRRNSVFVGSSAFLLPATEEDEETPRRAKSAFDLQSLVLAECNVQNDRNIPEEEQLEEKKENGSKKSSKTRLSLDDDVTGIPAVGGQRRMSICRFDDFDGPSQRQRERSMGSVSRVDHGEILPVVKPWSLRDRDSSICYFDRTDVVLTRPFRGDRDSNICHFDRMDVLARPPTLRDRGRSVCQFDRMDVLARPNTSYFGKSLFLRERERRLSVCNFMEKNQDDVEPREHRALTGSHILQRYDRRSSVSNVDEKIGTIGRSIYSASLPPVLGENACDNGDVSSSILDQRDDVKKDNEKKENSTAFYFDRPSCSKTSDVALGYKATRV